MQQLGFLAGLPRSGSTLLGALLSQRPDMFVSATSNIVEAMGAVAGAWERAVQVRAGNVALEDVFPILRAIPETHYRKHACTVLDKSRNWPAPRIMDTMTKAMGAAPRIVATVRPIAECLASFMRVSKFAGSADEFAATSQLAAHLFASYHTLRAGFEAAPDNFLFIEYQDLVDDPQGCCDAVAEFYNLPPFIHTLTGLSNPVPEHDAEAWNVPGLHDVRSTISRLEYSAREVLGERTFNFYQGGEFWTGNVDAPRPPQVLDLQLEAALRGDFDAGWRYCQLTDPDDDRAAFNKGWYLLRQGKLLEGMRQLDRGRRVGVFGSRATSSAPLYDGRLLDGEPVLLIGEGGLGDQICNARFARTIAAGGGKVILACEAELASLLSRIEGVSAVVQHAAAGGVYHKYYVPMMSAPLHLGLEYGDLDGSPYLPCPQFKAQERLRVGIRWSGNPQFEHEQHQRFDPAPLFALEGVDLVSLQDVSDVPIPDHVAKPTLDNWSKTANKIARCDLIISSCTAVAHLSAAMGKPTWIIVPILPYYIWSLPQNTSPWYNSVRLFRQERYDDWSAPFNNIRFALEARRRKHEDSRLRIAGER